MFRSALISRMRSKHRCFGVVLFSLLLILTTTLFAQNTQSKTTTFTSFTELVLIPTVVNDKSGSHIAGLKKEDFVLKQDGKSRAIAIFEEVTTSSARLVRSEGEHGIYSNFELAGGEPRSTDRRRLNIIVLDFLNTPFLDRANARKELLKFLTQVAESGEPICLLMLTSSGLTVLHDFTDDPKSLSAGLSKAETAAPLLTDEPIVEAAHPPPGDALAAALTTMIRHQLQGESQLDALQGKAAVSITVQALQQIAKAFRGLPGRKALIWASSGFSFSLSPSSALLYDPEVPAHGGELQSAYDSLWKLMNDAQIAIYSVDLRSTSGAMNMAIGGVRPSDIGDPQYDTDLKAQEKTADTSTTLQLFAENTGGKAFLGGGNLAESFRQAINDNSSYYVLGYYVNSNASKPGWHDVAVTLHSKGAHIRYRNGFFLSRDSSAPSARQDIQLALSSPLDYTGVPISVSWSGREPGKSPGTMRVQFDLVMPAGFASVNESDQNHMIVDIAAVAKDLDGHAVQDLFQRIDSHLKPEGLDQIQHNGMTYRGQLQLPTGEYSVRFVVRDSLGNRMGSVAAPVKVTP